MSGLHRIGRTTSALRLDRRLRWTLYAAFAVLFATGVVWLAAQSWKDSPSGDFWEAASADMLMIHGGTAMLTLVLLGALIPVHMQRAWRGRRNKFTGAVMATVNSLFAVTAFGLYYAGSDTLRAWVSDLHIAVGFIFPVLLIIHICVGRFRSSASANVEAVKSADRARKPAPTSSP
jgi:hypothetical protein